MRPHGKDRNVDRSQFLHSYHQNGYNEYSYNYKNKNMNMYMNMNMNTETKKNSNSHAYNHQLTTWKRFSKNQENAENENDEPNFKQKEEKKPEKNDVKNTASMADEGDDSATTIDSKTSSSSYKPPTVNPSNLLGTLYQVFFQDFGNEEKSIKTKEEIILENSRKYTLLTGLPLKPYFRRVTTRQEYLKDIWTFEQSQGFFNVSTTIRMTVVKLSSGDLWVHAPIAPTKECLTLLNDLGGGGVQGRDKVKYIILPTTAVEHKVFVKDFANAYPNAKVYVVSGQWSWPVNLSAFHTPFRVDGVLKDNDENTPWSNEIAQSVLTPPLIGVGPANEAVFYHKKTKTLIVTDLVQYITKEPPQVIDKTELNIAASETNDYTDPKELSAAKQAILLSKGWQRMCLQICFFGPAKASTFDLISNRLFVSPVIQTFVLSKIPGNIAEFINLITERYPYFINVIPAHFNLPQANTDYQTQNKKTDALALQRAFAFAFLSSAVAPLPIERIRKAKTNDLTVNEENSSLLPGFDFDFLKDFNFEEVLFSMVKKKEPLSASSDTKAVKKTTGKSTSKNNSLVEVFFPDSDMKTLRLVNDFLKKVGVANK